MQRRALRSSSDANGMTDRLRGKTAVVVGGGQQAGRTIGNGRATAITFAREGASVLLVDRHAESV